MTSVAVSTSRLGWGTSRVAAPVVAVLFRSSSWIDVIVSTGVHSRTVGRSARRTCRARSTQWTNSRQSILALIGSTLGYAGVILGVFVAVKQHGRYHFASVCVHFQSL